MAQIAAETAAMASAEQFEAVLEHPRRRQRGIFPKRIVALATSMQHQVEAGNHAEPVARERAEPSHFRLGDRRACDLRVGIYDFVGAEDRTAADIRTDPTPGIGKEANPSEV